MRHSTAYEMAKGLCKVFADDAMPFILIVLSMQVTFLRDSNEQFHEDHA